MCYDMDVLWPRYGCSLDVGHIHTLFKYSALRGEDFKGVQVEINLETHNFQQHTEVCWLSIGPTIQRILTQWEAICHFISELVREPKKMQRA